MAPHQVQKPQRSTYAPSMGSSTRGHEGKARIAGRRKTAPSPSRPSQPSRTRCQQRARLRLASSSDGSLPPRSDLASAVVSEATGARNRRASPQATGTMLVTGGTTIRSLNGMVTVNMSCTNAGSESPSSSSSLTLASPQMTLSTPFSSSETYETISDVYRRHMGLSKKGRHALWSPQPYLQLSFEYRKGGTQVGDVGIITEDGAFDFMFNICGTITRGSNGLANLPAGIAPIYPPVGEEEVSIMAEHSPRDALTSQGVSKHTLPNGEFVFTCAQPSGAILVLPDGSVTARLLNYARFQKYYARNAEAWYTFALTTRGPDVRNGDLHLVYGWEKATEWGIAAFDNPHRRKQPVEHRFRNMGEDWRSSTGTPYVWDHTDDAIGKVGPRDMELRELGASRDEPLRNQTLFIQSINTTLREEDWKRITDAVSMDVSMDFGSSESTSAGSISPGPSFTSADPSSQSQFDTTPGGTRATFMSLCFNSISTPRKQPSQVLNEYLLNQYPEAKVAAIASEVWSHVEDECLDAPEMLIAAVLAVYSPVVDKDGLISLVNSADRNATPEFVVAYEHTISPPHHPLDEVSPFQAALTPEARSDDGTESTRDVPWSSFGEMDVDLPLTIESHAHPERRQGEKTQGLKSPDQTLRDLRAAGSQTNFHADQIHRPRAVKEFSDLIHPASIELTGRRKRVSHHFPDSKFEASALHSPIRITSQIDTDDDKNPDYLRFLSVYEPLSTYESLPGLTGNDSPDSCASEDLGLAYSGQHTHLENEISEGTLWNWEFATGVDGSSSSCFIESDWLTDLVPQGEDATGIVKFMGDTSGKQDYTATEWSGSESLSKIPQSAKPKNYDFSDYATSSSFCGPDGAALVPIERQDLWHSSSRDELQSDSPTPPVPPAFQKDLPIKKKQLMKEPITDAAQFKVLNETYARTKFPSTEERVAVAKLLGMSASSVQIWFQNKRQSMRSTDCQFATTADGSRPYGHGHEDHGMEESDVQHGGHNTTSQSLRMTGQDPRLMYHR